MLNAPKDIRVEEFIIRFEAAREDFIKEQEEEALMIIPKIGQVFDRAVSKAHQEMGPKEFHRLLLQANEEIKKSIWEDEKLRKKDIKKAKKREEKEKRQKLQVRKQSESIV